jgi:hypothetical protein
MSHDVYLYYEPEGTPVAKTVSITVLGLHTPINVDIGHEGQLVGVEALDVDTIEVNGQRPLLPIVPDPSACRACGCALERGGCPWCDGGPLG